YRGALREAPALPGLPRLDDLRDPVTVAAIRTGSVVEVKHPLVQHKLSYLRDKNTPTVHFRKLVNEITLLLTYEATKDLPTEDVEVGTPLERGRFPHILGEKVAVCPILRAGAGLLHGVLSVISRARGSGTPATGCTARSSVLHTLANHLEVIWGALLAASIVVLLTPAVGGMARLLGVVDRPGGRRLNRSTVPRLGGLALFFGIFVPALAFLDLSGETRGLLLGAAVATTVGAIDDFRGLRWWEKLGGQVVAAAIPVSSGIWVHRFTFPILGIHSLPDWVGMP